jgi:hypothetical protein
MGSRWQQLIIPLFSERIIGFSIPQEDSILVVSYEGMHIIHLTEEPVKVETDEDFAEYDCYDPDTGIAEYQGRTWSIIGLYRGTPILKSLYDEDLRLDSKGLSVAIWRNGTEIWSSSFENFSGDWVEATFSPKGDLVVLGCPYDFDFRVWRRC